MNFKLKLKQHQEIKSPKRVGAASGRRDVMSHAMIPRVTRRFPSNFSLRFSFVSFFLFSIFRFSLPLSLEQCCSVGLVFDGMPSLNCFIYILTRFVIIFVFLAFFSPRTTFRLVRWTEYEIAQLPSNKWPRTRASA